MIRFRHASLAYHSAGCTVLFEDGTSADAIPHPWDPHYAVIAHRCGYGDDLLAYCREHEAAHLIVEECLHDRPSRVLWAVAHGAPLAGDESAYEELAAQSLQRFLRAAERPIIGGVNWDAIRAYAFEKLGELQCCSA